MSNLRQARAFLGALRQAAVIEERVRRVAGAATHRQRNPREYELVEISPGVWAVPQRRAPVSKLGRLHDALSELVDAFDVPPKGRR